MKSLADSIPRIDILLDDGGHTMEQQINTFEVLFPEIDKEGVYLCEDIHTSYWRRYGGGYKKRGSFIEYSKNFIDDLNAWHSKKPRRLAVSDFTRTVSSLHYYDSILVIEKGLHEKPTYSTTGSQQLPDWDYVAELSSYSRIKQRLKKLFVRA